MQIHYAGKITKDNFLKALLLHSSQLKRQKWLFGIVLSLFFLAALVLQIQKPAELADILSSLFPSGLIILVFLTFPWWVPYVQSMSYDQKGNIYRNNVFGMIDETEITISGTDIKANFRWDGFINYKVKKDMLLLYRGPNNFNIFITSMFSNQDEWEKFTILVKDKLSSNKKRA